MNAMQRRMKIFEELQQNRAVQVQTLADRFGVSAMTIRRDLLFFEKQGAVTVHYGGAMLKDGLVAESSFVMKSQHMMQAKQAIGAQAARLVQDGETIIVDCGTTALELVKHLQRRRVTIITNSLPVASFIQPTLKTRLILASGKYNEISAGVLSEMTVNFFNQLRVDRVFIGSHGMDASFGASVQDVVEAEVKKAIQRAGKRKYLLLDHTKFDIVNLAKHAAVDDFDAILCDRQLPDSMRLKYAAAGAVITLV